MDVIKCFRTREEAEKVAKRLSGTRIEILAHGTFYGLNFRILHNGKHLLTNNKALGKERCSYSKLY